MKLKRFKNFKINENLDDSNYTSPVENYDSDRKWFVVDVEDFEIVSAWDELSDAFNDGIVDSLLVEQGVLDEEQAYEFKDEIDDFLSEYGYVFDDEDFESTEEIDDFLKNMGVEKFTIRHRSELY
jgi:hypothetical protein